MAKPKSKLEAVDPVWKRLNEEAAALVEREPILSGLVHSSILHHDRFEKSLSYRVALKLASDEMPAQLLREICLLYTSPSPRDA